MQTQTSDLGNALQGVDWAEFERQYIDEAREIEIGIELWQTQTFNFSLVSAR